MKLAAAVLALLALSVPALADPAPPTPPIPSTTMVVSDWKALTAAQAVLSASIDAMTPNVQNVVNDDIQARAALEKAVTLGNWWENYAKGLLAQMKEPAPNAQPAPATPPAK